MRPISGKEHEETKIGTLYENRNIVNPSRATSAKKSSKSEDAKRLF